MRASLFAGSPLALIPAVGLFASATPAATPDPPVPANPGVDYVLVTNDALAPAFAPLVADKVARGLAVEVRTVESILAANPPGRDDPERIRSWLRARHERDGLRYVLLGGDATIVPARMLVRHPTYPEFGIPAPSDAYYSSLRGSWDADGDDVFGEWDEDAVDFLPELAVGRAPVRTVPEAEAFVAKTLAFRDTRDLPVRNGFLFLAETVGLTDYAANAENMVSILDGSPETLNVVRRYESSSSWPGSLPLTRADALAELGSGSYTFVTHVGLLVCDSLSAGDAFLTSGDLAGLANPTPFVFFAGGPVSGLAGDCVVESTLGTSSAGAVAVLGSSGVAFVGPMLSTLWGLFQQVHVDESRRELGEALRRAIVALPFSDRNYLTTWVLLGDPELDVGLQEATRPAPVAATAAPGPTLRVRADGSRPSPGQADIELGLPAPAPATLTIHDVQGRLVRRIDLGWRAAGSHRLRWDGRDVGGAPVASGVYFARVAADGGTAVAKVVLTR